MSDGISAGGSGGGETGGVRKLSIVFVSSGTNNFIIPYLDYFQSRGHQVSLISYDSRDAESSLNCTVYDVSFGAHGRRKSSKWRYLLGGVKAGRILRSIKPDILHGHYVTSAGTICLLSGFRPFVVSARGTDIIGSMGSVFWRILLRRIFSRSSMVHTVSDQLTEKARQLGVPETKLLTLTQGVDTERFCFQPPPDETGSAVKLLCIRALGDTYDPATIVRACKLLDGEGFDYTLTFAAGGRIEEAVKAMVSELGLEHRIRFMGGYANADLPNILHHHDLYVSASRWDGTSVSLLEAMAAGIFPVVSRIDSNLAWLEDGRTSLMFDCGNEHQLADAILRAAQDNQLRISAIQANRKRVHEKADRTINMKILENKYYEILGL